MRAPSTFEDKLATPVARLAYPPALDRVLVARNVRTVRDLVSLRPREIVETYDCGTATAKRTGDVLRAFLGVSWADARRALNVVETPPPSPPIDLDALGLERAARELPVDVCGRAGAACRQFGVHTLADAARASPRMPRHVRQQLMAAIRALPEDVMLLGSDTWDEVAVRALARLTPRQAFVLRRNIGLDGEPDTQRALARELGITAPRVGQIVMNARRRWRLGWCVRAGERLERAAAPGARVEALGRVDPFFTVAEKQLSSLARFIDALEGPVGARSVGGRWILIARPEREGWL